MRGGLLLVSSITAMVGTGSAIFGIRFEEFKVFGVGMVLLFAGAVFALLFVGTRPAKRPAK